MQAAQPSLESPQRQKVAPIAWALWGTGVLAYSVAVLHRTSFGVVGLDAVHRFDASAGILASFTVLQLLVYAGLQIPVGLMLDRVGPRRMVAGGALLMAAGQALMAVSTGIGTAVTARVMVGAGDAVFIASATRPLAWRLGNDHVSGDRGIASRSSRETSPAARFTVR